MRHLHRSNIHMRALIAIGLTLAACEALGSSAHAQDAPPQGYEALANGPVSKQAGSPLGFCDSRMDYGTGDDTCGTMTGGPSGGNSTRN